VLHFQHRQGFLLVFYSNHSPKKDPCELGEWDRQTGRQADGSQQRLMSLPFSRAGVLIIIIFMFYYAIMVARQNNTVQYTHIHANASTKRHKKKKTVKKGTEPIKHVRHYSTVLENVSHTACFIVCLLAGANSIVLCCALGWRRGVVVSGVRRMNDVNARRVRLVPGWVTVFGRVYHLGM